MALATGQKGQTAVSAAQSPAGRTASQRVAIDAALTGLLALAIFGPIVGMNATAPQGGLVLEYRWGTVFWLVAIVIVAFAFFGKGVGALGCRH